MAGHEMIAGQDSRTRDEFFGQHVGDRDTYARQGKNEKRLCCRYLHAIIAKWPEVVVASRWLAV